MSGRDMEPACGKAELLSIYDQIKDLRFGAWRLREIVPDIAAADLDRWFFRESRKLEAYALAMPVIGPGDEKLRRLIEKLQRNDVPPDNPLAQPPVAGAPEPSEPSEILRLYAAIIAVKAAAQAHSDESTPANAGEFQDLEDELDVLFYDIADRLTDIMMDRPAASPAELAAKLQIATVKFSNFPHADHPVMREIDRLIGADRGAGQGGAP